MSMTGLIAVVGAGSVVGRMLAHLWAGRDDVIWITRADWDARQGANALGSLIRAADAVVCLAGVTSSPTGSPEDFNMNVKIGVAVTEAAVGRPVLLASTQAVYGPTSGPHREYDPVRPGNPYGASKLAMEQAVADATGVTCLRLGNVMGADLLGRNERSGQPLTVDQFQDGRTPRRSYIDPTSLALVIERLLTSGEPLPSVLNVARAPALEMGALLQAIGTKYRTRPAPEAAVPEVAMDCSLLFGLVPEVASPVSAHQVVKNWRRAIP